MTLKTTGVDPDVLLAIIGDLEVERRMLEAKINSLNSQLMEFSSREPTEGAEEVEGSV